jgi:zinc transport system substrate-binding protein
MVFWQKSLIPLIATLLLSGCGAKNSPETVEEKVAKNPTLEITVSIPPQEYFVKKIGGDRLNINVMVSPGDNYHVYEPKPQQLTQISKSTAYITIGIPFETAWLEKLKVANPQLLIIDSGKDIKRLPVTEHDHHEGEEEHEEGETEKFDSHIWLAPELVKIQAKNITDGLITIDPEHQEYYQNNLDIFLAEINNLNQQITDNLAGIKNRKFIVFHPSWAYFAQAYNLEQIPIEVGGQEPSALELAELIKVAKQEEIKVIFAQPEFSSKSAETIAKEINGQVLFITPLAEDWSNNLLKISETFKQVLN